nr:GDSL-type esterase/lipase family protein [Micromonospora sp. DSM 115978]
MTAGRLPRSAWRRPVAVLATIVCLATPAGPASAGPTSAGANAPDTTANAPEAAGEPADAPEEAAARPDRVDPDRRDRVLPADWAVSDDRAWATVGDADGFHLLVADSRTGYTWRTAATLAEPGFEADQWIGNACLTGSGRHVVVVYAPRTFTNEERLFHRGGFVATVDLAAGTVTKLPVLSTLAYHSPGCGAGDVAVVARFSDGADRTRLTAVDAGTGSVVRTLDLSGQVTSAVPVHRGGIVAADGARLVRISADGRRTPLVRTTGVPFHLAADGGDAVVFMDRAGDRVRVSRSAVRPGVPAHLLALGVSGRLGTASPIGGRVFLTGTAEVLDKLPDSVNMVPVRRDARLSTRARLALDPLTPAGPAGSVEPRTAAADPGGKRPVRIAATVLATAARLDFTVVPQAASGPAAQGRTPHPSLSGTPARAAANGSPTDPVDSDRICSVPRNDPRTQVYQPTARQVEWAVDQAVLDNLRMTRPANWKQSGLPAWSPQGMFPRRALSGGGRVPAQVMLGVLAQESNLWQATRLALPGVTANPLIANYYGRAIYLGDDDDLEWVIDWQEADCGYGIAQVTDGMVRAGRERDKDLPARPANQQRAIALDYATNIAAGLDILSDKWNQTRDAGLIINNGSPDRIENWFFALWAYNSGFYPEAAAGRNGGAWGVGWLNNPVNPNYPADRPAFLDTGYGDAAHPQDWPYPEKVIGWAGHPISSLDAPNSFVPGYRAAWWTSVMNRSLAKPPVNQFCDSSNDCQPGGQFVPTHPDVDDEPAGPCAHTDEAGRFDLRCWYHGPSTWKPDCQLSCGRELHRFDTSYPEQPDGTNYPPVCTFAGLPAGSLVVDDVADAVPSVRPQCGHPWTGSGTFELRFAGAAGNYPSKVDFHQIGGGFGGHFWFGHTRTADAVGGSLAVEGSWTLDRPLHQWARVMVHIPDHGAHTQQARYVVDLGNGTTKARTLLQRTYEHRWVPLGVFRFAGTPRVRLGTTTYDGTGVDDIAFDAVAFQPLAGKPRNLVVSLGDSFSSGEGASVSGGGDYYPESDNNGDDEDRRNACHRSRNAWSRKAVLADRPGVSIGARADDWDPQLDHHLIACSGAVSRNLLPFHTVAPGQPAPANAFGETGTGQYGELSQLDKGFLDENTTLVTLSIGGNDARFSDIVTACVNPISLPCYAATLSGDTERADVATQRRIAGPVRESVGIILRQIHAKAPNAKILLMGYPRLVESSPLFSCIPELDSGEVDWLAEAVGQAAEHLAGAAEDATAAGVPTWFANPIEAVAGSGVCGDPECIHGIVLDRTPGDPPFPKPSSQSFHPKNCGTTRFAQAMDATLRRMGL